MIAMYTKHSILGGSREIVWAKLSDRNGNSLNDMDISMTILPDGQRPTQTDWKLPDRVTHHGRVIRAGIVFQAPVPTQGVKQKYSVFARGTESPEDIWVLCGQFTVV